MHIIPQLRKLEEAFPGDLVVIGVHSAKFLWEGQTESVSKAVLRYGIQHPVVNDRERRVWTSYAVEAWPSIILLDPLGKAVGGFSGEFSYEGVAEFVEEAIKEYDTRGWMDRRPLSFRLESQGSSPLLFPGKVLADQGSGQLFIADSGHHRIVVASLDGQVTQVIGSGRQGLQDGDRTLARFNRPQGMALEDDTLYVADTDNHALRVADLASGEVSTVVGTGVQAYSIEAGPAAAVDLNSPWDIVIVGDTLFIAMAGTHQIWSLDMTTGAMAPHAGTGQEAIQDGALHAAAFDAAALAQPSGITTDGQRLYFADSESSAIRIADISALGEVRTIVGTGLFDFGDADGMGEQVLLQHPVGIAWHDGVLYVADTYNHKIKRVFPGTRAVMTFLGDGEAGLKDGPAREARFNDPTGVSVANGKLYIADANNHAIRVADLATGEVTTLELRGL